MAEEENEVEILVGYTKEEVDLINTIKPEHSNRCLEVAWKIHTDSVEFDSFEQAERAGPAALEQWFKSRHITDELAALMGRQKTDDLWYVFGKVVATKFW